MKKQIRSGVFETNSSSTHSVTISNYLSDRLTPREDNKVHSKFGEFGWEIESYNDAATKLSYALTMVIETECRHDASVDFYNTEGFMAINELIKEKCNCDGVCVDSNIEIRGWRNKDGSIHNYYYHDGYIDHQSCEDYSSLQDFLDDYSITLEEFIFSQEVWLNTDNDNH